MKFVSWIGLTLATLALSILFSFASPFNPGEAKKAVFAGQVLQPRSQVKAVVYAVQSPTGPDNVRVSGPVWPVVNYGPAGPVLKYGPDWPVVKAEKPYGPELPPDPVKEVLTKARSLTGLPYQFGSNDASRSLDCSSYVQLVYKEVGLKLPRVTYDQFKLGTPIPKDQLKPGDLLFFTTYQPGPSHIGIYIGNGEFIHESPPGVQVTRFDKPFYQQRFVGARRILPSTKG